MKTKYHISYDGVARKCNARVNPCPLGEHYSTLEDARDASRERNKRDYSIMPSIPSVPREQEPRIRFNPNISKKEAININASIMAGWFKGKLVPTDPERGFIGGNLTNLPSKEEFVYNEWFAESKDVPVDWIAETTLYLNSTGFRKKVYILLYDEFERVLRKYYEFTEEWFYYEQYGTKNK